MYLYATHYLGTKVYDTICQGCDPDPNNWPKVGGQPAAIHCGHSRLAPACPLHLLSKKYYVKAKRITQVTKDNNKEQLEELGLGHLFGQINVRGEKTLEDTPMYEGEVEPENPPKWSTRNGVRMGLLKNCTTGE